MRKNDIILIVVVILFAMGAMGIMYCNSLQGAVAVITVDGQVFETVSLQEDQVIMIPSGDDYNILQIKDGMVKMIEADCKDQICVNQKAIQYQGESIICLPHKVIVTIESDEESNIDAVAN